MSVVAELARDGLGRGVPVALVVADAGAALVWAGGSRVVSGDPADVLRELAGLDPRWVWWSARGTAAGLVAAGVRPRTCWDLAAVSRLLYGTRRDDESALWADAHGLPEPDRARSEPDLLDLDGEDGAAVRPDGQLSREWVRGAWCAGPASMLEWARLVWQTYGRQRAALADVPDPRAVPTATALPVLVAQSESAAALLAVELEHDGLPVDRSEATRLLTALIGPPTEDEERAAAQRRARDDLVLRHFPDVPTDLRSPGQVRELLTRVGLDLPDTRSWRLEPYAATVPAVADLLAWRKAERIATTYGWHWLATQVGADGRLRGPWSAADAAAGRMTAGAGLHNLPADLRPLVCAEPGHVLVDADLGQVEPRVLAAVSGDLGLAAAAAQPDMYAPVAARLRSDRPTAKVAVLAAMYGQTTGAAGQALADMERAYPVALDYLRAGEQAGRDGVPVRTYGGRLLAAHVGAEDWGLRGRGRYVRNALVQGAAAELFKAWAATVRVGLAATDAQIVLCLHDELLIHAPSDEVGAVRDLLHRALESTAAWWGAGSGVRFVADVTVATSWAGH